MLYISGYTEATLLEDGVCPGCLLQKPFAMSAMAAKVRQLLDANVAVQA